MASVELSDKREVDVIDGRKMHAVMSAIFVCLLNHANHDLSSQTARRTRLSILSGSLIDSLVVTGTRGHARMHEVDTSAVNYGTSTSLFDITEQP